MSDTRYKRRRPRKARKPLRRLARRAQYKRGARAQSRQIRTIARHLSTLKHDVRKDLTMRAVYGQSLQGPLKTTTAEVTDVIIPLTCGVAGSDDLSPYVPMTNLRNVSHTGWDPIFQPRELNPNGGDANRSGVPPWAKIYNQSVSLRFWAGTIKQPTVITVSCIRVNSKAVSNIKSIASRLDGENHEGPDPSVTTAPAYITRGIDYQCSPGVVFSQPAPGGPPTLPTSNPNGSVDLHWNNQLYTVEYQKTFVLGGMPNPLQGAPNENNPLPSKPLTAPASLTPDANQGMEVCKFNVKYGGLKLSGVPPLNSATAQSFDPMEVTATQYVNIPTEHKRWLVISSSDPQAGASAYCPYMQMNSIISATVPT